MDVRGKKKCFTCIYVIVRLYIDGILITQSDNKMNKSTNEMLESRFDMNYIGCSIWFLELRSYETRWICFEVKNTIRTIFLRGSMWGIPA